MPQSTRSVGDSSKHDVWMRFDGSSRTRRGDDHFGQGGLVTIAGISVGLAAALAGSRLIETLLYDVSPRDPVVFVAAILGLFAVALAACWLPARRAACVSPVDALRAE